MKNRIKSIRTREPKLQFNWEKHSYKSYGAHVGPLSISVKRYGWTDNWHWGCGEIFGIHHADRREFATPEEAMVAAEQVAGKLLLKAATARGIAVAGVDSLRVAGKLLLKAATAMARR